MNLFWDSMMSSPYILISVRWVRQGLDDGRLPVLA